MFKNSISDEELKKREQKHEVEDDPETQVRGPFDRDYTAILYSSGFSRLKYKTQVFFDPSNDHLCTRLDHSLFVASIAESICKAFKNKDIEFNVDICKAIALGHDLGHPPFGHSGEDAIRNIDTSVPLLKSFNHRTHSLRFVDSLSKEGNGLNLTLAVRNGILHHTIHDLHKINIDENVQINDFDKKPFTWETVIIHFADKFANILKDVSDAYYLKIIDESDLKKLFEIINKQYKNDDIHYKLNSDHIKKYVEALISYSVENNCIGYSDEIKIEIDKIICFKKKYIYDSDSQKRWIDYIKYLLKKTYDYYMDTFSNEIIQYLLSIPDNEFITYKLFHDKYFIKYLRNHRKFYLKEMDAKQIILDFIVGMTDRFAIKIFNSILHIDNIPL